MKRIINSNVAFFIVLFCAVHTLALHAMDIKPDKFLIINAHCTGDSWSSAVDSGIRSYLGQSIDTMIYIEYLDRVHFCEPDVITNQARLIHSKYYNIDLTALIVYDPISLDFVLEYRSTIFPGIPIIFCGPASNLPPGDEEIDNFHYIPVPNTTLSAIEWAVGAFPDAKNIVAISDQTVSDQAGLESMRKSVSVFLNEHEYHEFSGFTAEEIVEGFASLEGKSFAVVLNYCFDRFNNRITQMDINKILALSDTPIITNQRDMISRLAVGGFFLNGTKLGDYIGKRTIEIVRGTQMENPLPFKIDIVFDSNLIKRFDIPIALLPDNAVIQKEKSSIRKFIEIYAGASIYLFAILIVALILTIILFLNLKRTMRALKEREKQIKIILNSSQISLWKWRRDLDALVFDEVMIQRVIVDQGVNKLPRDRWHEILHPDSLAMIDEYYQRMDNGEIDGFDDECLLRMLDGGYQWFRIVGKVTHRDRKGMVLEVHGMILNIHSQKISQAELFQTHALMHAAIDQSPAGILIAQAPDVRINMVNSAAAQIRGVERRNLINSPVEEHFMKWQTYHGDGSPYKPEDLPLSKAVQQGVTTHNEILVMRDVNGEDHWIIVNATPIRNNKEEVTAGIAIFLDITESRKYQQKLAENEERYRMIFDNSPLGIFHYNSQGVILEVNEKMLELLDTKKKKLIGQNMLSISQDSKIQDIIRASLSGKAGYYEGDYSTLLNRYRIPVRIFFSPVFNSSGEQIGGLGIAEDMSDWRRAEQALVQSEEKFRILSEKSIAGINISQNGVFKYVNPRMTELFGYTEEEMLDMPIHKIIYPDDMEIVRQNLLKRMHGESDTVVYEFRGVKKSGEIIHIQTFGSIITYRGEMAAFGTLINITERKRAEEERIRLEKAIDQTSEAIFITDSFGIIQYVNPAFEKLNGYMRYEVIGRNASILIEEEEDQAFYDTVWDKLRTGTIWSGILTNRRKNGTLYNAEATFSPIRDNQGMINQFVVVLKDVTDRVRIEKQLRQSQKMEAIGTLAGGIAHDFNNILGAILGYTELVVDDSEQYPRIHKNMIEVMAAASRAKELVAQILAFSRQKEQEKKPVNVLHIVKEVLRLLRSSTPTTIEIKRSLESKSPIVMADPTQIHQIVMNLCTNASQAMKENGGILDVRVRELEFKEPFVARHELKPGKYVCLTVADTGKGIPPNIMERIFEPYFTTKKQQGGTGLGLAIVHGIIRNLEGDIVVSSEEGAGTEFVVYLPMIEQKSTVVEPSTEPLPKGTETILFIDDEDMLINFAKQAFARLGYNIITFKDPREALQYYQRHIDKIDLVITDQTMPKMTGAQLATAILHEKPGMPIVLCTGFSETISRERALQMGIREYVMKPLIMKEMAFIVRDILDQSKV